MSDNPAIDEGLYEVPSGKLACVVTSLEMRGAPVLPDAAGRADLSLRRVPDPGVDWYRDLFRRVGEPWLWTSRLLLDDLALSAILADRSVHVLALKHDGADQGLLELDFRVEGECELAFFGLAPSLIGRGAGRWLMNEALRRAWAQPIGRFWLHTCTLDHPAAIAFYRRSGFVPFRQQVEVGDDPRRLGIFGPDAAPLVPLL